MSTLHTERFYRRTTIGGWLIWAGLGMVLLALLAAGAALASNTKIELCNEARALFNPSSVVAVAGTETTDSPSFFPPGLACSFYTGNGDEVVLVNPLGTTYPSVAAVVLISAGVLIEAIGFARRKFTRAKSAPTAA